MNLNVALEMALADFVFSLVDELQSKHGVVGAEVYTNGPTTFIEGHIPDRNYKGPIIKIEYGQVYIANESGVKMAG